MMAVIVSFGGTEDKKSSLAEFFYHYGGLAFAHCGERAWALPLHPATF